VRLNDADSESSLAVLEVVERPVGPSEKGDGGGGEALSAYVEDREDEPEEDRDVLLPL